MTGVRPAKRSAARPKQQLPPAVLRGENDIHREPWRSAPVFQPVTRASASIGKMAYSPALSKIMRRRPRLSRSAPRRLCALWPEIGRKLPSLKQPHFAPGRANAVKHPGAGGDPRAEAVRLLLREIPREGFGKRGGGELIKAEYGTEGREEGKRTPEKTKKQVFSPVIPSSSKDSR